MKIRMRHLAVSGCLAVLATTGSLTAAAAEDGTSAAGSALHHTGQWQPPGKQVRDESPHGYGDGQLPGHGHKGTPGPRPSGAPSQPNTGHGGEAPHTPSAPTHTSTSKPTPKPSSTSSVGAPVTPPAETPTPMPPHGPMPSMSDNGVPTQPTTTPATSTPSASPATRPRPPELAETGDTSLWMLAAVAVAALAAGAGCLVLGRRRAGR
ncbi:LPXTG cell wall anchor domain-containing protein [Streptomyces sp. NPDC059037]|uniref:LPXTG cell wall anchor domain-containing protein n=1 Tax=Streptomyces sp. NPDC059037 TaxID=3346710 RepID=UPI00367EE598